MQAGLDLLDDLLGHRGHIALQTEVFHKFQLVPDAHAAEVHNADAAHRHRPGDLRQAVAVALGAGRGGHALLQLLPGSVGLGLPEPAGNVVEDALKGLLQHPHAVAPVVGHAQLFSLGAVEDHVHHVLGEILHRLRQGKMIFLRQRLKIHTENGIRPGALPAGRLDRAVKNGLILVRNHQIGVGDQLEAQAGAAGTCARRIVEGEHPRLQLRQADAAVLAGVVLGKAQLLPGGGQLDGDQAAGVAARRLDGVRQAAAQAVLQHQPVNHQLDGVLLVLLAGDVLGQIVENPVHPYPGEAGFPGVLKHLLVLALLPPDDRRQDDKAGSLAQGFHPVHNLVDGLAADLLTAPGAVGNAHPRPQEAEIIVDFRHRSHGGTGVFRGGLLVNGNGRGQAVDGVHVRLVHLSKELAGVRAQALDVPSLSLGVNGVEGQAGLAGAGKPGENHQLVSGDGQVHVFQVVLPRAPNDDLVVHTIMMLPNA